MREIHDTGTWWLPDKENQKVGGTLDFQPTTGAILTTDPALESDLINLLSGGSNYPVIYGWMGNKPITLLDNWSKRLRDDGKQTMRVGYVCIGHHLGENSREFNRAETSFSHLHEFCGVSNMKVDFITKDNKINKIRYEVSRAKKQSLGRYNKADYSIHYGYNVENKTGYVGISEPRTLVVELPDPLSLPLLVSKHLEPVRKLVSLATSENNYLTELHVKNDNTLNDANQPAVIEVLFQTSVGATRGDRYMAMPTFTLKEVNKTMFNGWMRLADKNKLATNIVFGQLFQTSSTIENQLVNAVSAAEVYHHTNFKDTVKPEAECKERVGNIMTALKEVETLSSSDRKKVKNSLEFLNRKSKEDRLRDIIDHSTVRDKINDIALWSSLLSRYRTAIVHNNPRHPNKINN
jgi:hypothetical protein